MATTPATGAAPFLLANISTAAFAQTQAQSQSFPEIGASPGSGGVFETLLPDFDIGYSQIIQTYLGRPLVQPTVPRALSDPRCIVPGAPAKTFSYEIFEQVDEYVNISPYQNSVGSIELNQLTAETAVISVTKNCVIAFEGHDVVDLPTSGLPAGTGGGIVCPTNVFFPIYAGSKFVATDKDDFVTKSELEYDQRSTGNGVKGMVPNDSLPLDSIFNDNGMFNRNVLQSRDSYTIDATSNVINGAGAFVSYVAIDKPYFRDVITSRSAADAQGTFVGTSFVANFVGPVGALTVYVIRYAMVDVGTPGNPKLRWKMTESFGIDPKDKPTDPPTAVFNASTVNAINAAVAGKHYAYNINESGDEIAKDFVNSTPLKKAYNPTHALAMMDPSSQFYDPSFKTVIQPLADGSDFFQSRLTVRNVFPAYRNIEATLKSPDGLYVQTSFQDGMNLDGLSSWRNYESPINAGDFNNLRLGFEYALHQTYASGALSSVQTKNPAILLTKTQASLSGISAFYDPALSSMVVMAIEAGTATERRVSDNNWDKNSNFGVSKGFVAGDDSPFKTGGATCLYSLKNTNEVPVGSSISVPGGYSVFELVVSPPSSVDVANPPVLTFGTGTSPTLEIGLGFVPNGDLSVPVPPLSLSSMDASKSNGMKVKSARCCPNVGFLPSLENVATKTDADILDQIKANKAQDGPITCGGIAAIGLGSQALFAYSSNNSIHLGFRNTSSHHFMAVRDVVHRMGGAPGSKATRPSASMPCLVRGSRPKSAILLYQYQSRILSKNISYSTFDSYPYDGFEDGSLSSDVEARISADIQSIPSTIAYDGHVKDPLVNIGPDVAAGYVFVDTTDVPLSGDKQESPNITSYSACLGRSYAAIFIQDGSKIKGRRSSDDGRSWSDIFEPDMRVLPSSSSSATASSSTTTDPDGLAPFCYIDRSTGLAMFFMFSDSALLSLVFPESLLLEDRAFITKSFKDIEINVAYGELSPNLKARGVKLSPAVIDRQAKRALANNTDKETISPQSLALSSNQYGLHRLFYYDSKQIVKSLISIDHSNMWLTESQFQDSVK